MEVRRNGRRGQAIHDGDWMMFDFPTQKDKEVA